MQFVHPGDRHRLPDRVDDATMAAGRDDYQAASLHDITRRMLVGMTVGHEAAAPLILAEVIRGGWLDQCVGQYPFKRLARDIASGEWAIESMGRIATNRLDLGGLERGAVERSPRGRLFVPRADPFHTKCLLAAGKQA